jgi:3-deoxy-D-manno-octulosonic-acid transferase
MKIIYNIAFIIFSFFYIPVFLLKKRRREGVLLRLGIYNKALLASLSAKKNIWIHAVSVGEVGAVAPFISQIHEKYPEYRIVLSTVTETGNAAAKRILSEDDIAIYLPFDLSFIVKKVIGNIRPVFIVLTETELWPNLISKAYNMGIKVFLVNGRISDSSFKRYCLARPFLAPVLKNLCLLCMQTESYGKRIISLGAYKPRVFVLGNMKFDSAFLDYVSDQKKNMLRNILRILPGSIFMVAGSTHPGEEEMILNTYIAIKRKFPDFQLLIAPRHIERANDIIRIAQDMNIETALFSQVSRTNKSASGRIILLDSIGWLKDIYSLADVVFVGGSLIRKGGQNMIEPAVFSRPIIIGPYTHNFHDIVHMFMQKNAIAIVKSGQALTETTKRLIEDRNFAKMLGQRAKSVVESNRGVVKKILGLIENEGVFL